MRSRRNFESEALVNIHVYVAYRVGKYDAEASNVKNASRSRIAFAAMVIASELVVNCRLEVALG